MAKKTMKKSSTRKHRGSRKGTGQLMDIPQLRQGMHYISQKAQELVRGAKSLPAAARQFAREWKQIFGKTLPIKAAEKYLKHVRGSFRFTRKQRGGVAPLDYTMGPGANAPYGKYPEYLMRGGLEPPMPGQSSSCGREAGLWAPSANDIQGNQQGGGLLGQIFGPLVDNDLSRYMSGMAQRPVTAQNPETPQHQAVMAMKGASSAPGPNSYETTYQYRTQSSGSVPPIAQTLTRALGQSSVVNRV